MSEGIRGQGQRGIEREPDPDDLAIPRKMIARSLDWAKLSSLS